MNIVYTGIYQYMCCIYQYILVYTSYPVTGFRGGHRDAAMLDASQPPVEQEPEEGDPSPCPEDEEFFVGTSKMYSFPQQISIYCLVMC